MSDYQFQGIVAVGNTQSQAINRYRMMAMGKGVTCFVDRANGTAFVSNAASDMDNVFNPANGNMDLVQSEDALNSLQFEAKAGDVHEAYHFQCVAGCGAHLVFDSPDIIKNCPQCATSTSAVASDEAEEEEEVDAAELEFEDDDADDADEDDDSDSDEDDEDSDPDSAEGSRPTFNEEEDDMADAPKVVAASTREEASIAYVQAVGMTATASDGSPVEAHYMVCAGDAGCGAHIISEEEISQCPRAVCGADLSEPEDLGEGVDMNLLGDDEEIEDEDEAEATASDDAEDDADADDDEDLDDEDLDDEPEGDDDEEIEDEEIEDADEPEGDDAAEEEEEEATASDDNASDDNAEAEAAADEAAAAIDQAAVEAAEDLDEVEADLLEQLPDDVSADDLDVSYSAAVAGQPIWTAYHKGTPVAIATASSASETLKPLFGTPRFGAAAIAASKLSNAKSVLREVGFVGIRAKFNVPRSVDNRLQQAIAGAQEELAQQQQDYAERLEAALASAGIGLTRGFFQGESNPVRESLNAALASAGVRNPEVLVDNALRSSFEGFLRQTFHKAAALIQKPVEVQEALARSILETSYLHGGVATASAGSDLESRLAGVGVAVASSQGDNTQGQSAAHAVATAASAGADDFSARLQSVMSGLGSRR